MKYLVNLLLKPFGRTIVKTSKLETLQSRSKSYQNFELADVIDDALFPDFFANFHASKSQLKQDLFVLSETSFKTNGFFVEFGATNGIDLSNSYLLEKNFNWTGILAEPAKTWHDDLKVNRTAAIETECVWSESGQTLLFNEVTDDHHNGELSTIDQFSNEDGHKLARASASKKYTVETISLLDLLKKHNAPKTIDYLSIDTEGSEYEILNAFDFDEYDIKIITCEHNYTPMREKIFDLLTSKGYVRKFPEISRFDDWYVRP